ncbi:MAG: energy transducer TonB [Bacteroidales bacterium]|nr:energy transducer TonB [Bacteroidales bacterium]
METKKTPKANLENKKLLFREIGLAIALLLAILSFEWKTYDKTISIAGITGNSVVDDDDVVITRPELPQPEPLKAPIFSEVIEIVEDNTQIKNDLIFSGEDIKNLGVDIKEYKPQVEDDIDEIIPVAVVEEKPKFMGGDENEFTKWVFKNMVYPDIAMENNIQGRVILSFVVGADGRVVDVKVLRGVDPSLDKEAVRVISMSPKWTPGENRGKPARVKYTFPVIFQLR